MHHKNIKAIIKKQLKKNYPDWKRLNRKKKKEIAKAVLDEVVSDYDFNGEIETSYGDLLGIEEQMKISGIMNLEEMGRFIESHKNNRLLNLNTKQHALFDRNEELKIIDNILDDCIINQLLSYEGYRPCMREFFPSNFLRAELLKAVKYPEISYRKFCHEDYMGRDQKLNRIFMGLPLNTKQMISHVQMSQFRSDLSFVQMVNITVYILYYLLQSDLLGDHVIHCADSSEVAGEFQKLLAKIEIKGQKIRIYNDIDCDCGTRRNKRDKSVYVVGYRIHTLTAVDVKTGRSFPLISLLGPANHHDSNFYLPLIQLGKAVGLDLKFVTADEAYTDTDGSVSGQTGVHLITPPKSTVSVPENVDTETMNVMFDENCEIPMDYLGAEDEFHEFKCGAAPGECFHESICPKFRHIPIDGGRFQRIPYGSDQVKQAIDIRKNAERPFNLMKKREGLETARVRSQHGLLARCTFTTMATLLLEIAGTRRKTKFRNTENRQYQLPLAA